MSKCKTICGMIYYIQYKHTSVNGNPSYYVHFKDENGEKHFAITGTDCAIGYGISSYNPCLVYRFTYHYTKTGTMIITNWNIEKHGEYCVDWRDL